MKYLNIGLVACLLCAQSVKSQDSVQTKNEKNTRPFFVGLKLLNEEHLSVYLMAIRDSAAFVFQAKSASHVHKGYRNMNDTSLWDKYNYNYLTSIKIIDKKLRAWTIVPGSVAGLIAGVLIGKNSSGANTLNNLGNQAGAIFAGAILGGAAGALTGVAISNILEKKYLINGEWRNLEDMKKSLKY